MCILWSGAKYQHQPFHQLLEENFQETGLGGIKNSEEQENTMIFLAIVAADLMAAPIIYRSYDQPRYRDVRLRRDMPNPPEMKSLWKA